MRLALIGVAVSLGAAACANTPAAHGTTIITVADAQAQVRHYEAVESQAYTKRDPALSATVEAGSAVKVDAAYLAAQSQSTAPPPPPWQTDQLTVYVPYQSTYPAQFLAHVVTESPIQQPSASLLLFVKATASAAWKVVSALTYEQNTPPPDVSLDDAGYATLLSAAQAARLPVPADHLSQAYTSMLTANLGSGAVASVRPFAPGPLTTGKILSDHQSVAPAAGVSQHVAITYAPVPADTPAVYRLSNGGALVLFNSSETDAYVATNGSLDQNPTRTSYSAVIPAGSYSSIKVQGLAMNAAVEAANPSSTAVHVVGGDNNGISGSTT